jgi:hypothetical protein
MYTFVSYPVKPENHSFFEEMGRVRFGRREILELAVGFGRGDREAKVGGVS